MLIADGEVDEHGKAVDQRHYTAIKSLSRLLRSSNGEHKCKQHFCRNCLQGSPLKSAEINISNIVKITVRMEMPKEGSLVKLHNGQYQFKVPFTMYADFEAILEPIQATNLNLERSYTKVINQHIPSSVCGRASSLIGKLKIHCHSI